MHLDTSSSTMTATMAYPSLPASPTLTNPDMILPYGEYDSTPSPQRSHRREPSLGDDWRGPKPAAINFSIGLPHNAYTGPITPTTPIIYGNGTMLSDIGEVTEAESAAGRKVPGPAERRLLKQAHGPSLRSLRSSPTKGSHAVIRRTKSATHERNASEDSDSTSSTIKSQQKPPELFADFDDSVSVDDSNFQGDDEESVADSYSEQVFAMETQRLARNENSNSIGEDGNSSAALSRRAEQILLNAKRRLNNMEGNLSRARSSLYTNASGSPSSIHFNGSPLSGSTPSPQNDLRGQYRLSTTVSPGHSRVFSENSIPPRTRSTAFPVRSSSAGGGYGGRSGSQRSPVTSQTPENAREDDRIQSRPAHSVPVSKSSPTHAPPLGPVSEDEIVPEFDADRVSNRSSTEDGYLSQSGEQRELTRSASSMQMRDLRDQMHDLKGRLSVLRDRARDDTMKRRSMQSLRTPSPFTAAEQWYAGAKGYQEGTVGADTAVEQTPWNETTETIDLVADEKLVDGRESSALQTLEYAPSDNASVYEEVSESPHPTEVLAKGQEPAIPDEEETNNAVDGEDAGYDAENDYIDELVDREEADEYESDTSSLYHDTFDVPISHEDREDAFDYEHFFLHSAMGTISQQRSRRRNSAGSFSSEDSVETTRGPITSPESNDVNEMMHLNRLRSKSGESVSSLATYATAEEDFEESGDGDAEGRETYAVQHVNAPAARSTTPLTATRATFGSTLETAENDRNGGHANRPSLDSLKSFDSGESTGTTRSFPLVNKPKSQNGSITRRSPESELGEKNRLSIDIGDHQPLSSIDMLVKDDQILVERLVASLGKCVLGLQDSGRGSYEGRVWRRRLDAARRVLEGHEGAI